MRAWRSALTLQMTNRTFHPLVMRWSGYFATLAMLALLAWVSAQIFWALTAPQPLRAVTQWETDPQRAAQAIGARHLFGVAPSIAAAVAAPSDIRLTGVIAAQGEGQPAFALLALDGKPAQVVREGDEVAPGIQLQRVLPRQVELLRGGQPQLLSLPERGKP